MEVLTLTKLCFSKVLFSLSSSEQCCAGKIGRSYGARYSDCCGSLAYNSRDSFCHGGSIYQRCNYKSYDPVSFMCCDKELVLRNGGKDTKCCGKKSYNR